MIILDQVSKGFALQGRGSFQAIQSVSLHIRPGDIHGIIGTSGAGKSTLLRLMNGLEKPDQGSVRVDGQELTAMSDKQLREARRGIGMIFQQFNLLRNKSVSSNVAVPLELAGMPAAKRQQRVEECLEFVGLSDRAKQYPAQLSGGQQQRVAIARALANQPRILLCDEPTSALDPQTTAEILHVLQHINQRFGVTIVIVSHEMEVVRSICHHVSVMEHGRVTETLALEPTGIASIQMDSSWYREQLIRGKMERTT